MNNSLVKLEDFQLDEISGGITAKQVGAYAIKGTSAVVLGVTGTMVSLMPYIFDKAKKAASKEYDDMTYVRSDAYEIVDSARRVIDWYKLFSLPLFGAAGWKLGEWLCEKIGLED